MWKMVSLEIHFKEKSAIFHLIWFLLQDFINFFFYQIWLFARIGLLFPFELAHVKKVLMTKGDQWRCQRACESMQSCQSLCRSHPCFKVLTKQRALDKWPYLIWATSWEILFMPYANNKGADEPAPVHLRSLISTFVVHCLDSIISLVSVFAISWH